MQRKTTGTQQRSKTNDEGGKEHGKNSSKEQGEYHQREGDIAKISGTLMVAFLCGLMRLQLMLNNWLKLAHESV